MLTSWNGLCMAALAKAGRVLGEPHYREEAERTWAFLQTQLETAEGRLSLRWREGQAAHQGQLDDYAFLTWALLELYATCFETRYLQKALAYAAQMETLFWDTEQGGFYRTARDAQPLLTRPKETYDGAMPSGNSVAAWGLVRLAALTGEPHWQQLADQQLDYLASAMQGYPAGFSFALLAMGERASSSRELVCVVQGEKPPQDLGAFCERFGIHALLKTRNNAEQLAQIAPFTASYPIPTQGEAFYLCQNGACQTPVFSLRALETMLSAR